jgi:hypothetical protein
MHRPVRRASVSRYGDAAGEAEAHQQRRQPADGNHRQRSGGAWQFSRRRLGNKLRRWLF